MKNGDNIQWTDNAINELKETIHYLQEKWTVKELKSLAIELEKTTLLIAKNPFLFQESEFKKTIRRVVVLKHNTLCYRITGDNIQFLSF
jgi:plasmid stabilization system protein ParE